MARPRPLTDWTPPSTIKIDELNPRQSPKTGQREAIQALIKLQTQKIVNLAKDINKDSLSAAERFMVIESDEKGEKYISLDGNRRLLALKLLADPTLAQGILTPAQIKTIEKESKSFLANPIEEVEIAIYASRRDGAPWVARRHGRNLKGVGQDSWGAEEGAHFEAWLNETKGRADLQILKFVRSHGNLTKVEATQLTKFSITNLRRIITNDLTKKKFGYQIVKGDVVTSLADAEIIKPFKKMLLDMSIPGDKRIKVTDLDNPKLRKAYLDTFTPTDLPSADAPLVVSHVLGEQNIPLPVEEKKEEEKPGNGEQPGNGEKSGNGEQPGNGEKSGNGEQPSNGEKSGNGDQPGNGEKSGNGEQPGNGEKSGNGEQPGNGEKPGGKDDIPTTQERKHIIPTGCYLKIPSKPRINDIYRELKDSLEPDLTPNACAVLLRVFIELSMDAYIDMHPTDIRPSGNKNGDASLGDKIWASADYAEKQSLITPKQAENIKDGAKGGVLAPRTRTMHLYVHNADAFPSGHTLRAHWNNIEPLMKIIWP